MNVYDEVELSRILARIVPDSSTKVLGAFGLPQYTLYAKKEWHLGLIRETKFRPERGATAEGVPSATFTWLWVWV